MFSLRQIQNSQFSYPVLSAIVGLFCFTMVSSNEQFCKVSISVGNGISRKQTDGIKNKGELTKVLWRKIWFHNGKINPSIV